MPDKIKQYVNADIVQLQNPKSGRYIKIDRVKGIIISHKKSDNPYKGINIIRDLR